jgi:hypothetical protein
MKSPSNNPGLVQGVLLTSPNREDVLQMLQYFLEIVGNKVSSSRAPRNFDVDRNRREWVRAGIYCCSVCLSGIKDADGEISEEILERVKVLQEAVSA